MWRAVEIPNTHGELHHACKRDKHVWTMRVGPCLLSSLPADWVDMSTEKAHSTTRSHRSLAPPTLIPPPSWPIDNHATDLLVVILDGNSLGRVGAQPLARTDNRVWTLDGRGVSTTPCRALTGPMGSGSPPCGDSTPVQCPYPVVGPGQRQRWVGHEPMKPESFHSPTPRFVEVSSSRTPLGFYTALNAGGYDLGS
jgi:hypothetical protein